MKTAQRQRVLFVISSLQFGGMEKHTVSLLNGLDATRFAPSLVTLREGDALLAEVDLSRLSQRAELGVRGKLDFGAVRRLREWLRQYPQDILICVNEYPMLYAWLALRGEKQRPKLVEIFHTTVYRTFKERMQFVLYRRLLRGFDLLVYVSSKQRDYWHRRRLKARRDIVIHNGIDVDRFLDPGVQSTCKGLRARLGFEESDYVLTICAALRPEKAHVDLVEVVQRLRRSGLPAKALFVGDGGQRTAIEVRADSLGVREHVVITGLQKDVRPYLRMTDVFVLCSHSIETFSVAALEAMASAKPLVMTRIGGAEEQVTEGVNGFLFEPGDIPALTRHLETLNDAKLRAGLGQASRDRVCAEFTEKRMLDRYAERLHALSQTES